jgi:hypothetical protein
MVHVYKEQKNSRLEGEIVKYSSGKKLLEYFLDSSSHQYFSTVFKAALLVTKNLVR